MIIIEPFGVERWMFEHEMRATYNVAESCASSISIEQLREICSGDDEAGTTNILDLKTRMTYGEPPGSAELRTNIARLYPGDGTSSNSSLSTQLSVENVLVTAGAIAANHLVFYGLVRSGDHVICHHPTYQQLYTTPASVGAAVTLWKARPETDWALDADELASLAQPNTSLIVLNNPQNPTGAVLSHAFLQRVVDFARPRGITILCDEVYRPLFHSPDATPPSILDCGYARTIATGSLSKAFALAGIRVGWVASREPALVAALSSARDYTTISVSQLDSQVAAYALAAGRVERLLARNVGLARENLAVVEEFVARRGDVVRWVRPAAGTTAFVQFVREERPVRADPFCKRLLDDTGVMFLPGDVGFGEEFQGYVRVGYVCETDLLKEGLRRLEEFLKEGYQELPLHE